MEGNNIEGYNSKLKKHVGIAHPKVYKAINVLQKEEVVSEFEYLAALKGDKPPPRNKFLKIKSKKGFKKLLLLLRFLMIPFQVIQ